MNELIGQNATAPSVVEQVVMADRLRALMEGLEVENLERAMTATPDSLRELGRLVARQAKMAPPWCFELSGS